MRAKAHIQIPGAPPRSIGPYLGYVRGIAQGAASRNWLSALGQHIETGQGTNLTEGRHRNIRMSMPTDHGGICEVVVKSFSCSSGIEAVRSRYRGTKATRSWLGGMHLLSYNVGTPEPLALLERRENGVLQESYYVARYEENTISFAEALNDLYRREPDGTKLMALLQTVANAIREMHSCGFVHYDLGNQNILLQRLGEHVWGHVSFIDLNRGRIREGVTDRERGRDFSRIALPSDFLRVFREMYAGEVPSACFLKWESHYRKRYAWHSRTRGWRHPLREYRKRQRPTPGFSYPSPRSIWIWDPLSRQPLITMRRKDRKKHFSWRRHFQAVWSPLKLLPICRRQYHALLDTAYKEPMTFDRCVGVAVEWMSDDNGKTLQALQRLGLIPVFVRFYRHAGEDALNGTIALVRDLQEAGHPVSIGLLQDRVGVEQPDVWKVFVDTVLSAVGNLVELVEVGHAINRVKWGIWTFEEYTDLLTPLVLWKEKLPDVRFGGPAVIDFEYAYIPAALDHLPEGMRFDVLTHHLYVDRRGAPENPQAKFALLEKLALARAISQTHRNCADGLIITEFNWPLAGTGIHSPVGAPYVSPGERHNDPSVSEEDAAAYLLRYVLITIGSGLAERVFWWSLVAHGFGLIDGAGGTWRERPAYKVLQVLLRKVQGASCHGRVTHDVGGHTVISYVFRVDGGGAEFQIVYATGEEAVLLPLDEGCVVYDAFGKEQDVVNGALHVQGMPVYVMKADPLC